MRNKRQAERHGLSFFRIGHELKITEQTAAYDERKTNELHSQSKPYI
jgi:hypothetical protein